jgi:hypothetical protein
VLDAAWSFLESRDSAPDFEFLSERSRHAAPAGSASVSVHEAPAVGAAFAATLLVEAIASGSLDKAVEAAQVASDAAESYAQADLGLDDDDADLEARVAAHPLVQQELRRQREDIKLLRRTSLDLAESVAEIKERWAARAIAGSRTP